MESFDEVRAALLPSLQLWEQTLSTPHTPIRLSNIIEKPHVFGFYAQVIFESQELAPNPLFSYTFDFIEDEGPVLLLGMYHQQQRQVELDFRLTEGIQEFFETKAPMVVGILHALCPKVFDEEDFCQPSAIVQKYPERSLIY